MALIFYAGSGSPFSWRVHLALEHKRVPYELRLLSFQAGDHKKPEFLRVNPRGKVPALLDGDFALWESGAILEYLDERFADGPPLIPGELRQRAVVRRCIQEAEYYVGAHIGRLGAEFFRKAPGEWDPALLASESEALQQELGRLEAGLTGDYLAGPLSAADFTLYPHLALLGRFELRKPDLGATAAIGPKLTAWMRRIESLPYFEKTYPPHWRPQAA